jgi:RHS repeat-associated protein
VADCGATYVPANPQWPQLNLHFTATCSAAYVYFRGRLVRKENMPEWVDGVWQYLWEAPGVTMGTDRLGSVRYREYTGEASYYPYGEEETPTANDTQKFATYTRDSATGLDYAQNRYYASQIGRFTTADPNGRSARGGKPLSWNRYAYVVGDPVNANDPAGMEDIPVDCGGGVDGVPCIMVSESDGLNGGGGYDGDRVIVYTNDPKPDPPPDWVSWGPPPDGQLNGSFGTPRQRLLPVSNDVMQMELDAAVAAAMQMLLKEPSCAGLFGLPAIAGSTPPSPEALLQTLVMTNSFTFGTVTSPSGYVTSASTGRLGSATINLGGGTTMGVSASVTITLNNITNGASFVTGTPYDQAVTILHELGHAYGDMYGLGTSKIVPDSNQPKVSNANDALIKANCK